MPAVSPIQFYPDGLTKDQRDILGLPLLVPPGYGMRVYKPHEKASALAEPDYEGLYDRLLIWEPPRKGFLYVGSCDVSNGQGLDNSVIDITRCGTIREGDEQVAQFVTSEIEPDDLAYYIDAIGRLYKGRDTLPALIAIECNGLGLGTQSELNKHIGYNNLFIWRVLDSVDPAKAFTQRYGWYTSQRSRPLILGRYYHAIKTVDPHTGLPDYRINSPHTLRELQTFVSPGALWMAEAAPGAHDDCIMAGAIGVHVALETQESSRETVHDARKRISEESSRMGEKRKILQQNLTAQNTDATYAEAFGGTDQYDYENPHE